jgi:hypothetical protein
MKIRQLMHLTFVVALVAAAADARACGEVMYRMGGALHYHAFLTKHPAQIILYSSSERRSMTDEFHHNLEKAGHKVTVVDTPEAFSRALGEHPYDVVIGYASDLPVITAKIEHAAREPSLIPVFAHGGDEHASQQRYPLALTEDANLNDFLKTIEKSMKSRGT